MRLLIAGTTGVLLSTSAFLSTAHAACGDNVIEVAEACDDGNLLDGDGCSDTCTLEAGFMCTDGFAISSATWIQEAYTGGGSWTVNADGSAVTGANPNSAPSVMLSDFEAIGSHGFTIQPTHGGDDDFIGFVLGFNLDDDTSVAADYLLFDWKGRTQNAYSADADAGLALSRVSGIPTDGEFWGHTGAVTELARANTLGATGWVDDTVYSFRVEQTDSHLQVWVNDVLEFDIAETVAGGNFGFYAFSQIDTIYAPFGLDGTTCTTVCGDGFVTPAETCDDGAFVDGDGCTAACEIELGYACTGAPSVCDIDCGDGIIYPGEACDDGNDLDGDGCSSVCAVEHGFVCQNPIDLTDSAQRDIEDWGTASTWTFPDATSARQTINTDPSVLVTRIDASAPTIEVDIVVESGAGDDDFIGLALGVEPGESSDAAADFLLIDWKRVTQTWSGQTADLGLALSRVNGIPTTQEYWGHNGAVTELARGATLGSTGWAFGATYRFTVRLTPHLVTISVNGVEEFSVPGDYGDGFLGFYDFSQQGTVFSAVAQGASACDSVCGDGLVATGEACDDGNGIDGDGCSSACLIETGFICEGEPSSCSDDVDGDGLTNTEEGTLGTDPRNPDTDGDGVCDGPSTPNAVVCTAGSDNCPLDANSGQEDSYGGIAGDVCDDADGDSVLDVDDNCPETANNLQEDGDVDGFGDVCDVCPADPDNDADDDMFCADTDNCPLIDNDQTDTDGDGAGDVCDVCPADADDDADGDMVCGDIDNCPAIANDQSDADADGLGDACDSCPADLDNDVDGDAICGDVDNCPAVANFDQDNNDMDADGDVCDDDDDNDGMLDTDEATAGTDPFDADTDGDGLSDGDEVLAGTEPLDADTDDDGLTDGDELLGAGPLAGFGVTNPLLADTDDDGLLDGLEVGLTTAVDGGTSDAGFDFAGTNLDAGMFVADADPASTTLPNDADSDDDGLTDGDEDANADGETVYTLADGGLPGEGETDPNDADTDADGVQDGTELGVFVAHADTDPAVFVADADEAATTTSPLDNDSDDDRLDDGAEDTNGNGRQDADAGETDAQDADTDDGGVDDGTEVLDDSTDPLDGSDDLSTDTDGDGIPDRREDETGTLSDDPDTDDDGLCDGPVAIVDVCEAGEDLNGNGIVDDGETDPRVADGDDDGLLDGEEVGAGLDPFDADSDDDGVLDGNEGEPTDDADDDGLVNGLDADSDNDGILDGTELGVTEADLGDDTDLDAGAFVPDADPDTITDPHNADTDGGLTEDGVEDPNHNGMIDDGETDPNDPADDDALRDSDGDGLTDLEENEIGTDPNDADSDDDGVRDADEPAYSEDTDGDGNINALDPDSDNDGLFDGTELGLVEADLGEDTDMAMGAFVADADPTTTTDPLNADTDDGGLADGLEDLNLNGMNDDGETDPNDPSDDTTAPVDTDGDGLSDLTEEALGTNPNDADSDDDGVLDGDEADFGADTDGDGMINALDQDSDGDGLLDGTEMGIVDVTDATEPTGGFVPDADPTTTTSMVNPDTDGGGACDGAVDVDGVCISGEDLDGDGAVDEGETDPNNGDDDFLPGGDADEDGLTNGEELDLGTDPRLADTDGDGVDDGVEVNGESGTDPVNPDSDMDGLCDGGNAITDVCEAGEDTDGNGIVDDGETDPMDDDSDDDDLLDGDEVERGTDPLDEDSDDGGVHDGDEVNRDGTDPLDPSDDIQELVDTDDDGLTDDEEAELGTDPNDPDSDDDGLEDGDEVNQHETNPLDDDSDDDGLTDGDEIIVHGTDPLDADTDGGTTNDGDEIDAGTDPLDPADDVAVDPEPEPEPELDYTVSGGGCSSVPTRSTPLSLLLLGAALIWRRRRAS
ncbi:DUF4215 domain-containing protein [Microbacterium sp.]